MILFFEKSHGIGEKCSEMFREIARRVLNTKAYFQRRQVPMRNKRAQNTYPNRRLYLKN